MRRRLRLGRLLLLLGVAALSGAAGSLPAADRVAAVAALVAAIGLRAESLSAPAARQVATVALPWPHVTVYNGSDRLGLEQVACRELRALGIDAEPAPSPMTGPIRHSVVLPVDSPAAAGALAKRLAARLLPTCPGYESARAERLPDSPRSILILGCDWPAGG